MPNSFYTLVHKTVKCPLWLDEIRITAKYVYIDNPDNPYLARFAFATCEIVENLHKPRIKQDKRLGLYQFCNMKNCPHISNFPKEIDVRKP